MKNLKRYNEFVNESIYKSMDIPIPERDGNYKFLMDTCKKCDYEGTMHFYVKDLIEIGTCGEHKLYLNYLDRNQYDNRLSYWVVYNEKPDDLYGTSWDSGVIWEEDGELSFSKNHDDFVLFPNFIEIITNEIKSYSDLDDWCKQIKEMGIKSRKYHRWAIQNSYNKQDGKPTEELTWEERLDWIKNRIEVDKLLNRYKTPYDEKTLKEMETMGQKKFDEKQERIGKQMSKILKNMKF
jgi:hypothetical protein